MKSFIYLSPSLGYMITLRISFELIAKEDEIDIFLPKPVSYSNIIDDLKIISSKLGIKEFIILENPLNPFFTKKLSINDIQKLTQNKSFKVQVFLRLFFSKLITKFQIKDINPYLGNSIRYISSKKFVMNLIGKKIFKTKYDAILYELFEEKNTIYFLLKLYL